MTEASIAEWQTEDEGDACPAYLADLGRQDAEVRAAVAAQQEPTSAPESPAEPTDVVTAFWALTQHSQAKVERVAPPIVL